MQQDKIFAAIGSIGTPTAMAAMPIYLDNKVAHLFPLTGARQMFEPLHDLKYSFSAPYYDQIRAAMKRVIKDKNLKKVCAVYQDDDFGQEVLQGGEHALKDLGMTYAEKTSYKRGATDFSSQVAKMKEAGCDGVVMGTIIRETIGVIGTGRKLDWNPAFVGTTASYFDIIHKLGGAAVNGFYSACTINYPYEDDKSEKVRAWFSTYKQKYGEDPTVLSAYGYVLTDLFVAAADKGRQGAEPRYAREVARILERSAGLPRRRRAEVLAHQAPRLRPLDAVPDPGRQVEVGVGVFDELTCSHPLPLAGEGASDAKAASGQSRRARSPARRLAAILRDVSPPSPASGRGDRSAPYADDSIYAASPVAISSPASFTSSICATATRLPSRTTRPVAMK